MVKDMPYTPDKVFNLKEFQIPFYASTARFPAFVASWGTGKTTTMIFKGYTLSHLYKNNFGIIFRKTEKSLRDSTMRDFEDYTGIKVPRSNPIITIPATGSVIRFAHADDLKGLGDLLQNVNLGWVGIEQAEEMSSGAVFDMLRGRLRRIITPIDSIQKQLIKLGFLNKIYEDFRQIPNDGDEGEGQRDRVIKAIIDKIGIPYNQLMCIANTNGHNWIWRRWKKEQWEEYALYEAKSVENRENIPLETWKDWCRLKDENRKRWARMVDNSWEDYDLEGAYYAEKMSTALKQGRIELDTLYNPSIPVYTFWDLGIRASDTTAVWFVQFVGHEIWLVDYYECYSKGMKELSDILDARKYTYAAHYLPHDGATRMQGEEITTRQDILMKLQRAPIRIVPRHRVEERIACVRAILNVCKFNSKCEGGVTALNNYKAKKSIATSTEDHPVFVGVPDHDEFSNGSDAFGYMAVIKKYYPPTFDEAYNNYSDDTTMIIENNVDVGVTNILSI